MMSEHDIILRLEQIGYKNAEIRQAMKDVGQVIALKAAGAYIETLPEGEREKIGAMKEEEAQRYMAEHAHEYPQFTQERFDKIHDDTWEEYFKAVG